jgi:hypothetical protein
MQIPDIASAEVAPDGAFKVRLPNFAVDPFVSGDSSAEFVLYLTDRNVTLEARAEESQFSIMHGLKVAPSYPSDLIFVPRTYNLKPSSASPAR